jgi:hypothetical protein
MEVEHDVVDMDDIRGLHGRNCRGVLLPCRVSTDGYAEPGALTRCRLADLLGYRLATRPAAADGLKLLTDNRIRMESARPMDILTAHRLAQFIEWQHAKDRARLARTRSNGDREYDPLAATCLGDLIYNVSKTGEFNPKGK